jgi:hypothetical protein
MVVFTISLLPLKTGLLSVTYAETPPTLVSVNPTAIIAGASLTVKGSNFGNIATWKAVVELANGEKFEQSVGDVTATQFKITVPNIYSKYQGYKDVSKNAEIRKRMQMGKAIYVKKGTMVSNKLAFNIVWPSPWIDGLFFKAPAHPGDVIIVNGGNWDPKLIFAPNMFWGVFEYQPGKSIKTNLFPPVAQMPLLALFPFLPNTTAVGSFSVKIPDVFAGKSKAEQEAIANSTGKFYIYGLLGPNFASNTLNIKIMKNATSTPAGSCPGGKQFQGYIYVGQPGCATMNKADHPSAYLTCDATGYYCCEHSTGAKTKCGTDKWTFQPDCMSYCAAAAGNCLIAPLIRDGIFYGCYKTTH